MEFDTTHSNSSSNGGSTKSSDETASAMRDTPYLYQSLVNCLPICVFRTDLQGRITFANQTLQTLLQLSQKDILGKTSGDLFPQYLAHKYRSDDLYVIRNGEKIRKIEENINPTSGKKSYIEIIKVPIYSDDFTEDQNRAKHQIIGVQGAFWDVSARVRAEQASKERERLLTTIAECSPDHVMLLDSSLHVLYANRSLMEYDKSELLGQPLDDLLSDNRPMILSALNATLRNGTASVFETQFVDDEDTLRYLETRAILLPPGSSNHQARLLLTTTDITQQAQYELELQQASAVFSSTREAIVILNNCGRIVNINCAFTDITGFTSADVKGKLPRFLLSRSVARDKFREILKFASGNDYWQNELKVRNRQNQDVDVVVSVSAIKDDNQVIQSFVVLFNDISRQKQHQKHLERIAHYDTLTHLPNRTLLGKRLNQAMTQALESGSRLAVLYIDLDGFKAVNDRHGHSTGDRLLVDIAKRMQDCLDKRDTIARLGGDEFMVVVPEINTRPHREEYFEKLLKSISQPVHSEAGVIEVSASLGVSYFPQQDSLEADQLIRQADVAMFKAKVDGKNRFEIFDADKQLYTQGTRQLNTELEQALRLNQLKLYFQPKVNMKTGAIIGAEALLRWQHPTKGLLAPNDFLRADLSDHLAVRIDRWVIENALQQVSRWKLNNQDFKVSINVSIRMLEQDDFSTRLARQLLQHPEINPSSITLEVLESSAVQDVDQISLVMRATSVLGIRFSLDDFGTGYSTLNLLKKLPAGELKIDRSFVKDMLIDKDDLTIIRGVMGLALAFDKSVIAEGVESEQHGLALIRLGCIYAQGFGIATPMAADDFSAWATRWKAFPSWLECTEPV